MHINTESKNYKRFRTVMEFASFTGGCIAFDSVVIPFVFAVNRKSVLGRALGILGTYGMSLIAGRVSEMSIDDAIDNLVDFINLRDAKKNKVEEPEQYTYRGVDIPGKNATSEEEKEFVNKLVEKVRPFEFDSEESARTFAENMASYINKFGHADMVLAFSVSGNKLSSECYDILIKYGWTSSDAFFGVDRIADNCYIVDCFNYHDISDVYEIL